MILIYTTNNFLEKIEQIINNEHRLNELVNLTVENSSLADIVVDEEITVLPDWKNRQPPILFPKAALNANNLLGIIYAKLNNFEKAYLFLEKNNELLTVVDILNRIQNNVEIESNTALNSNSHYYEKHNLAIIQQYGFTNELISFKNIESNYLATLQTESTKENIAFTTKHYAQFLVDNGKLNEAIKVLNKITLKDFDIEIETEINTVICSIWIKQITIPYNQEFLNKIKDTLWNCLQFYENENRNVDAALLLTDAAYIATISKSYSEALGYATKACNILQEENLPELLADAQIRKANVLQTWAADGNPQFYRAALQSCLDALKVYTRETAPDKFADLQLKLGIIYAEIPDDVKKKGIWAAVSVSSFNEALNYYNKIDFPYEFAIICHQQANAYTKYPTALHTDNFDKALAWYKEALDVRTAENYPQERVETLLAYLDASWYTGNKTDFDVERFNDMKNKSNEVLQLTTNNEIKATAKFHLQKLQELKELETNNVVI